MEKGRNSCIKRTFQYCFIRWSIRSFSFVGCPDEFIIYGPEFTVNYPTVTKWKLGLKSLWNYEVGTLSIFLERMESDTGPETVWVNWKVRILDYQNRECFAAECESDCKKKHQLEMELLGFPEIYDILPDFIPDTLEIICDIIVNHEFSTKRLRPVGIDTGFESLSQDLKRLCNRGTFYDVVLKIDDQTIRAHRCVLAARNPLLFRFIQDTERGSIVEFPDITMDAESFDKLLRYFYTGEVRYVLQNPTISLIRWIEYFTMDELDCFFSRQFYNMLSKVMSHEYLFTWSVTDFIKKDCDYIRSEFFTRPGSDEVWQLHLFPRGEERDSSYMALFAEYISGPKSIDACVEFAVLDPHDGAVKEARRSGQIEVSTRLGIQKFISRDSLAYILQNDEMRITFTVRVSIGEKVSTIQTEREENRPSSVPIKLFYNGLSLNLTKLLKTSLFSDVVLTAEGRSFCAHKCILAARSKTLSEILSKTDDTVIVLNTKPTILFILLKYIYSGTLQRLGLNALKRIYESSIVFGIPSLTCHSSNYLKNLFSSDTIEDILEFAEDNKDEDLKNAALEFISNYENQTV